MSGSVPFASDGGSLRDPYPEDVFRHWGEMPPGPETPVRQCVLEIQKRLGGLANRHRDRSPRLPRSPGALGGETQAEADMAKAVADYIEGRLLDQAGHYRKQLVKAKNLINKKPDQ